MESGIQGCRGLLQAGLIAGVVCGSTKKPTAQRTVQIMKVAVLDGWCGIWKSQRVALGGVKLV